MAGDQGERAGPLVRGEFTFPKPEPIRVDYRASIGAYRAGLGRYRSLYRAILPPDLHEELSKLPADAKEFALPPELWAKIAMRSPQRSNGEGRREERTASGSLSDLLDRAGSRFYSRDP